MRSVVIISGTVLGLSSLCAFGQRAIAVPQEARGAAAESLRSLTKLVTKENAQQLGFESAEEVKKAALDIPIAQFFVPLDVLQKSDEHADMAQLLVDSHEVLFPVTVQGQVRSSIAVTWNQQGWKAAAVGSPRMVRALAKVRAGKTSETSLSPEAFFAVRVPALKIFFLGHRKDDQLTLTPIVDDARFGFRAGESMSAARALAVLRPAARQLSDAPG